MKKKWYFVSVLLLLAAALIPARADQQLQYPPSIQFPNQRAFNLQTFFRAHKCPENLIWKYIQVSDRYGLDYRLLPSISIIESTCGKHQLGNNWWGWNSDRTGFPSVEQGISFIANKLANGSIYKGKTLEQKLKLYNSVNKAYYKTIVSLMNEIQP